jgi:gamma-glutamyltranspeptidase / glutathione hydrolase
VAGDTGILLNNFVYWWDLDDRSPNYLRAGQSPPACISPALAISDGSLQFVAGSPGSFGILQIIPEVVVNLVDFAMSPQESVEFPRVISLGASEEVYLEALPGFRNPRLLAVEDRLMPGVLEGLAEKGHEVLSIGAYANLMGTASVIYKHRETNVLEGGADPRRDSQASCW